ncbi:MAG: CHAT domain-containing protein [Bryobacterales bacterium]|nr:CHAT domain-containing protein [Bryobacterales bacterium]
MGRRVGDGFRRREWWRLAAIGLLGGCGRKPREEEAYQEARLAFRRGDWELARRLIQEHPGKDEAWRARFRLLEAEIHLYRGERERAEPLLAQRVPEELTGKQLALKAYAHRLAGRYDEAISALNTTLEIAERQGDQELHSEALLHLARAWQAKDRWDEADRLYARLEATGDNYYRGSALINRGLHLLRQARFEPAIPLLQKADELTQAAGSEAANSVAVLNLALCRARLGQHEEAEKALRRLAEFHLRLGARSLIALSQAELGRMHQELGRLPEAISCFKKAADAAEGWNLAQHALACERLASALVESGRLEEAEQWNRNAREPDRSINAGVIAARRGQPQAAVKIFDEALRQKIGVRDRWTALFHLARAHRENKSPTAMHQAFEKALRTIEEARLSLERPDYQVSFLSQLIRNYQDYAAVLLEEGQLDKALVVEESSRARVLASRTLRDDAGRVTLDRAVARRLARQCGAALASYWLSPRGAHVWVATADAVDCVKLDAPPAKVAELVAEHNRILLTPGRDVGRPNGPGVELWRRLIAPVERAMRGRVLVTPDGPLHELNLETLVDGSGRYWLESTTLAVTPSLGLLSPPGQAGGKLLLVGDPVQVDAEFPALDHAGEELAGIREAFGAGVRTIEKAEATPEAFLRAGVEDYGYIHFTAHAAANRESPLDSAVILSAAHGQHKLYARDVMDLALRARLVTVSACRGAGARSYSGEGLVGFSWAFLRAGSRNVIAGLWDVADVSTARLMRRLYQGLRQGLGPAAALRAAKLELLAGGGNFARPFYWAPFQVYTRDKG